MIPTLLLLCRSVIPGDMFALDVMRHAELSDTLLVRSDTAVVLPLVGRLALSAVEVTSVEDSITKALSYYINEPAVSAVRLVRVSVYGEVNKPGVYILRDTDGPVEAVAMAGGPTSNGDLGRVRVFSTSGSWGVNLKGGRNPQGRDVEPGDAVVVPRHPWPTWQEFYYIVAGAALGWSIYINLKR